jgi:hypothetical protein
MPILLLLALNFPNNAISPPSIEEPFGPVIWQKELLSRRMLGFIIAPVLERFRTAYFETKEFFDKCWGTLFITI